MWSLFHGHHRFSDIEQVVPGLSARMLSLRLKELDAAGVVRRDVVADTPVRVEYHLTDKGLDLRDVLIALDRWAHRWPGYTADEATHRTDIDTDRSAT